METQTKPRRRAVLSRAEPSRVVPRSDKQSGTHVTSAHKEMLHVNIASEYNLTDVMLAGVLQALKSSKLTKTRPKS